MIMGMNAFMLAAWTNLRCFKIMMNYAKKLELIDQEKLLYKKAEWEVGNQKKSIYGHCALHAAASNPRYLIKSY